MSCDDSIVNLLWKIVLLSERTIKVAAYDSLYKWHQFTAKVIRCFSRHFCREMIDAGEEDIMLLHAVVNLHLKVT